MLQAEIEPEARDVVRATGLPRIPQNVVGGLVGHRLLKRQKAAPWRGSTPFALALFGVWYAFHAKMFVLFPGAQSVASRLPTDSTAGLGCGSSCCQVMV